MKTELAVLLIGIGATATMDAWSLLRKIVLGVPPTNWRLVGRWIAYLPRGRFYHPGIAATPSVAGEVGVGWGVHYAIGIGYAGLLIALYGSAWLRNPTIGPALIVGFATVAAPFLIMQPGMGAGIAGSRTPNPAATRLHSLMNHGIFGAGLYATAWLLKALGLI